MEASELIIVIPAYEPNHLLAELIDKLNQYFNGHKMIVVDDGSKNKDIFLEVQKKDNVIVLHHDKNMGKGQALKTGFSYIKDLDGNQIIVTADSDGQHKPEDICRVYNFYKKYGYGIVLGSRKFDCDIPKRSAFGNNTARFLLRLTNGKRLNDTQTGLRAFGKELIPFLISIKGQRYEYEMNMLAEATLKDIDIHEIKIETIYIDNNSSSHFRPVRDFSRICGVILKYSIPKWISIIIYFLGFIFMFIQFKELKNRFLISLSFSMIFAYLMNLLIHGLSLFNGNRYLFKSKRKCLYYFSGSLLLMLINLGIAYSFNLILNAYLSVFLGVFFTFTILSLEVYSLANKSILYEG